jgi:hypothetical protein
VSSGTVTETTTTAVTTVTTAPSPSMREATEMLIDNMYIYNKEWCLLYTKDFLYIWNPYCAIELSHTSNGWFRFLINNKLYSMYSNGKPEMNATEAVGGGETTPNEQGSSVDENKLMFVNRLLRAKQSFLSDPRTSRNIHALFSSEQSKTREVRVENWTLRCSASSNELEIRNVFAVQRILFQPGVNGIEFESNKSEVLRYVGLVNQGIGFSLPDTKCQAPQPPPKPTLVSSVSSKLSALQHYFSEASLKTHKLRQKDLKDNVAKLAAKLNEDYLKSCQLKPRALALKLINLVEEMKDASSNDDMIGFEKSLNDLKSKLFFCFIIIYLSDFNFF